MHFERADKPKARSTVPRRSRVSLAALLCCGLVAGSSAAAQDSASMPDYRDDRSTPEAVVLSLYNAVVRKEYLRAYSYLQEGNQSPDFADFAEGYQKTEAVRVKTGTARGEGAAGSTFYALPVVVESTTTDGARKVFTGCYELRLTQPAVQATPPFRPMGIVKGELVESDRSFDEAVGACPSEGIE